MEMAVETEIPASPSKNAKHARSLLAILFLASVKIVAKNRSLYKRARRSLTIL